MLLVLLLSAEAREALQVAALRVHRKRSVHHGAIFFLVSILQVPRFATYLKNKNMLNKYSNFKCWQTLSGRLKHLAFSRLLPFLVSQKNLFSVAKCSCEEEEEGGEISLPGNWEAMAEASKFKGGFFSSFLHFLPTLLGAIRPSVFIRGRNSAASVGQTAISHAIAGGGSLKTSQVYFPIYFLQNFFGGIQEDEAERVATN